MNELFMLYSYSLVVVRVLVVNQFVKNECAGGKGLQVAWRSEICRRKWKLVVMFVNKVVCEIGRAHV